MPIDLNAIADTLEHMAAERSWVDSFHEKEALSVAVEVVRNRAKELEQINKPGPT
jgi:hypothetical protein